MVHEGFVVHGPMLAHAPTLAVVHGALVVHEGFEVHGPPLAHAAHAPLADATAELTWVGQLEPPEVAEKVASAAAAIGAPALAQS